jgi:hypothetical protein
MVVQTILYSNKKPEKARLYKVRWVMEYPDEWLPYNKVPEGLRVSFKTRNATQRKGQKEQNTLSAKANAMAKQNEVEVFIFICMDLIVQLTLVIFFYFVCLGCKMQTGVTNTC